MSPLLYLCSRKTWQESSVKIQAHYHLRGSWAEIQANVDWGRCKARDERQFLLLVPFSEQKGCRASAAEQTSTPTALTGVWGAALTQHILTQEARSTMFLDVPNSRYCLSSLWGPLWPSPIQTSSRLSQYTLRGKRLNMWQHTTLVKSEDLWQEPCFPLLLVQQGNGPQISKDPRTLLTSEQKQSGCRGGLVWEKGEFFSKHPVGNLVYVTVYLHCLQPLPPWRNHQKSSCVLFHLGMFSRRSAGVTVLCGIC